MIIEETLHPMPQDACIRHYFTKNHVFFDIETTGFSSRQNFIYLIGTAIREEETIRIIQFLAENRQEESAILAAFYGRTASYDTLITYNGVGFDIPFLRAREVLYGLDGGIDCFSCMDLYKITADFSHLFHLPDKKQQTLEAFLKNGRNDHTNGGELIRVYYSYEKTGDAAAKALLLGHNHDDVLGMTSLLSLLSYRELFHAAPQVTSDAFIRKTVQTELSSGQAESELEITCQLPYALPRPVTCDREFFFMTAAGQNCRLTLPVIKDSLKFFYENYKDYYYLPDEDMAIHKSIATFVDASHRKKATARTCYSKKKGLFLPQMQDLFTPCFYTDYPGGKKTVRYFELTEDFCHDRTALSRYTSHLLSLCLKVK